MKKIYIITILSLLGFTSTGYSASYKNYHYPYFVNPGVVYGGGVHRRGFGYGGDGFHHGGHHGGHHDGHHGHHHGSRHGVHHDAHHGGAHHGAHHGSHHGGGHRR